METLHDEERALHRASRKRLQHLQDLYDIPSLADVKYDEWSRVRLNRLLVEYLVRQGFQDSAGALAREKGIEELVDLEVFARCHRIGEALRRRNLEECLAWCSEHKVMMRKTDVSAFQVWFMVTELLIKAIHRIDLNSSFDCSNLSSSDEMDSSWKLGNMHASIFHSIWRPSRRKYSKPQVCLPTNRTPKQCSMR